MPKPLVSVICETFNHEKYIQKCLDSILAQRTSFPFEIVVHDDASTDSTSAIVRRYMERYPDIVRAVLQTENQMSQGNDPFDAAAQIATGTYIAEVEGDDFWIDPNKLQMQIDYLKANPDCTFCFTNAKYFDDQTSAFAGTMLPQTTFEHSHLTDGADLAVAQMLQVEFIPTASFVFPRWAYDQRPIFPPPAFDGDRYQQLVMTAAGYAHFMNVETAAYRINNSQSMMSDWRRDNSKMHAASLGYLHLYRDFNTYTHYRYRNLIEPTILHWEYAVARYGGKAKDIRQKKFWRHAKQLGIKEIPIYLLTCISPSVFLAGKKLIRSLPHRK